MKRTTLILTAIVVVSLLAGCSAAAASSSGTGSSSSSMAGGNGGGTAANSGTRTYADGTYRGAYLDESQLEIQFALQNGTFTEVKFRTLSYNGEDYLKTENAVLQGIAQQYQALADHLIGKDISAVQDLYTPENIAKDTDTVASATLRSGKMISAINDGLNRGVYAQAK